MERFQQTEPSLSRALMSASRGRERAVWHRHWRRSRRRSDGNRRSQLGREDDEGGSDGKTQGRADADGRAGRRQEDKHQFESDRQADRRAVHEDRRVKTL